MKQLKCSKNSLSINLLNKVVQSILVLIFFSQSSEVFASNACHEVYEAVEVFPSTRTNITPEVQEAIDRSISNLAELRLSLDLAQSTGRSSMALTALTADYKKKEQALVVYLEKYNIMTRPELVEKIKQEIAQLQDSQQTERKQDELIKEEEARRKEEQERQVLARMIDGKRAIFHRIQPGFFMMGKLGNQVPVTISKPFDMMATQTTQLIWKKIADLANSRFGATYRISENPSSYQGDTHPVETVSFDEVQTWIKGLNELSQAGEPALSDLIPDHKRGDVYRLPTEAEWEFVNRGRGQLRDDFHFGGDQMKLNDYGWFFNNSGRHTHPVAQKKPLVIDGQEFYDIHGNVWEMTQDWYKDSLSGGKDPRGPRKGDGSVLRGGSFMNPASVLVTGVRITISKNDGSRALGFRLVRTVKSKTLRIWWQQLMQKVWQGILLLP